MKQLGIEITLRSPTLLAAAPPIANLTETLRFVPGNSLRGAFAQRYLELGGEAGDGLFERLFVAGEVAFGPAYPDGAEVVPLSARTCKYHGGFQADGGHGLLDLLLSTAAGDGDGARGCPKCGESLDHPPEWWHPAESRGVGVLTRLITRSAIDPRRATARTGQLFVQEVLQEGQRFIGELECPLDLASELERISVGGFEAGIGTGGSRGQGWVEIAPADLPTADRYRAPVAQRFKSFQELAGRPVLAVTLLSDALLVDDYLRAASEPEIADLATLGIFAEDWEPRPAAAFTGVRRVFGFDGAPVRLPRCHRLAVAAGSTFLFEAREEPRIPEGSGVGWIGDGRREGYGRVALWHPFHLDPEPEVEAAGGAT
ncbi:MAG: RAMP superfamily CRISPR-associated protein [Thermoanaerobaculia bacterium]